MIALRCFVRAGGRPRLFIAECIDLDLMVEAPTSDEAVASLYDAITGYLEVVFDGPHPDLTGLIPRPSPLSHRLRYHWECLKYAVAHFWSDPPSPEQSPGPERFYGYKVPSLSGDHCLSL